MARNRSFPSPLARAFESHQEAYKQEFGATGRMDWIALSEAVTAKGLVNADDKPPTAACCRLTWYRLNRKLRHPINAKAFARTQVNTGETPVVRAWPPIGEDDLGTEETQPVNCQIQPARKRNNDGK